MTLDTSSCNFLDDSSFTLLVASWFEVTSDDASNCIGKSDTLIWEGLLGNNAVVSLPTLAALVSVVTALGVRAGSLVHAGVVIVSKDLVVMGSLSGRVELLHLLRPISVSLLEAIVI